MAGLARLAAANPWTPAPEETEAQAQNRWHEDALRRKGSVFTQIRELFSQIIGNTIWLRR